MRIGIVVDSACDLPLEYLQQHNIVILPITVRIGEAVLADHRDEQATLRKLKEWNQPIHRVRGRIEKIFGTWKRSYGLRRMRWRGIAKAAVQIHLTAIAYNLKRTLSIIQQV